jgi:hypothetical protein
VKTPISVRVPRKLATGVLAFLVVAALALGQAMQSTGTAQAANFSPNFPRLATITGKTNMATDAVQRTIAKNNIYVTDLNNWPAPDSNSPGHTIGQYIKSLNPNLIALMYFHSIVQPDSAPEFNSASWQVNGTQYYIDPSWYMTYAGSSLRSSIGASDTSIPVADVSMFAVNDRVMLGGVANQSRVELATVTSISGFSGSGSLNVTRGTFSQGGKFGPIAHNQGDWVRTVGHTFGSAFWMVLNPTSSAPTSNVNSSLGPQTWNQFLASFIKLKLGESGLTNIDGVFLDNFVDWHWLLDLRDSVDINNTNQPSGLTDAEMSSGMQDLSAKVKSNLPSSSIIIGNTGGQDSATFGQWLAGGMNEDIDQNGNSGIQGNTAGALSFYNGWISNARGTKAFIMNGSPQVGSLSSAQTDYQAMRFLLTLTLTNDGYFSFDDRNVDGGHQTTWWYDEYDNAGQGTGYLGQPSGAATQPIAGVYRRDFTNGVSLTNTTGSSQTINLGQTFQKIKGSQAPNVNDGSLVTSVTLSPNDGIILLHTGLSTPTVTPTTTSTPGTGATSTATSTPSAQATATKTPTPTNTPVGNGPTPTNTPPSSGGAPAAPSGLSGSSSGGTVNLRWNASSTAGVTYTIYRGSVPGQETVYRTGVSGTSFADQGVQRFNLYVYKVTAVNSAGASSPSNEALVVAQ